MSEPHGNKAKDYKAKDEDPASSFDALARGLLEGDNLAYAEFWEQYGKRLEGVVRSKFPLALNRRLGPEDLVQSVCRSFFRRATAGQLELSGSESLWRLLCAIALNKTKHKQRDHYAQRRSLAREQDLAADPSHSVSDRFEPPSPEQAPDDVAMFAEQLEQVMNLLDPMEQQVLQLRLEGFTSQEISEKIHRSDRTVRRNLERLQEKLEATLKGEAG